MNRVNVLKPKGYWMILDRPKSMKMNLPRNGENIIF